jgi:hypothetical protein
MLVWSAATSTRSASTWVGAGGVIQSCAEGVRRCGEQVHGRVEPVRWGVVRVQLTEHRVHYVWCEGHRENAVDAGLEAPAAGSIHTGAAV